MKLSNIKNVKGFLDVVESCKGEVVLCSDDGDRLNLKSKLTHFILLSELFDNPEIKEMNISVSDPEDTARIMKFISRDSK